MPSATPQTHRPADEAVDHRLIEERAASVGHLFRQRVAKTPDSPAFMYAKVAPGGDEWLTVTWAEAKTRIDAIGAGLVALGVGPEDRVALASATRYEWALADLAVMVAGGVTTTIYPTTIDDDVAFILADSQSKVVFAEDAEQVAKAPPHRRLGAGCHQGRDVRRRGRLGRGRLGHQPRRTRRARSLRARAHPGPHRRADRRAHP